ncbi:MAG: hypothetical protein CM1200mP3_09470 [Chloroflexota bacterium]|nr:MAG: hypothetical protein CM1200mP3_09470 [Chloroflexota bacterium]
MFRAILRIMRAVIPKRNRGFICQKLLLLGKRVPSATHINKEKL